MEYCKPLTLAPASAMLPKFAAQGLPGAIYTPKSNVETACSMVHLACQEKCQNPLHHELYYATRNLKREF